MVVVAKVGVEHVKHLTEFEANQRSLTSHSTAEILREHASHISTRSTIYLSLHFGLFHSGPGHLISTTTQLIRQHIRVFSGSRLPAHVLT